MKEVVKRYAVRVLHDDGTFHYESGDYRTSYTYKPKLGGKFPVGLYVRKPDIAHGTGREVVEVTITYEVED